MLRQQSIIMIYLFTLAGGILLTIFHSRSNLFEGIVMSAGVLFLLPCVYMLAGIIWSWISATSGSRSVAYRRELRTMRGLMLFPLLGGIGFGVLLVSMPGFFVHYIIYTFGIILCLCGLVQTLFLLPGVKYLDVAPWWLIVPVLTICAGVGVFIAGHNVVSSGVALFTGIWLMCYAVNGMFSYVHRESKLRQHQLLRG